VEPVIENQPPAFLVSSPAPTGFTPVEPMIAAGGPTPFGNQKA
jgi:hypothetical protein